MDEKTLAALKASIKHWKENVAAETPREVKLGVAHCALCQLYFGYGCRNCPVHMETGFTECAASPYYWAAEAKQIWAKSPSSDANRENFVSAAQAELDFLKSLLPEGEGA